MSLVAEKTILHKRNILDFYQDEVNEEEVLKILDTPQQAIEDCNITIEEKFVEAALEGLNEANQNFSKYRKEPALWNSNLLISTGNGTKSDLFFTNYPWGLVLTLNQKTTTYVLDGISMAASISSAIYHVSKDFPIANVTENIVIAAYLSYLNNARTTIYNTNRGNGIYLTLTWPQIAMSAGMLFPTPTPVAR